MAIFQPTNVVPSSFTEGTVDAVKDNMEVSWQVNGNSAMTAFQIDFYLNDTASTSVWSTGKLTEGIPKDSQGNVIGFYGTDRFGRPQFFTWNAEKSWAQQTMLETNPITNGNNYKFKITQWYTAQTNVVSDVPTTNMSAGNAYYFTLPESGFVSFVANRNYTTMDRFYYDTNQKKGWVVLYSNNQFIEIPMSYTTSTPSANARGSLVVDSLASAEDFLMQSVFTQFVTRTTPTLTISTTASDYVSDKTALNTGASLETSIGFFVADYAQSQDIPIRWIRWQIATATKNADSIYTVGDILVDTGDIYTPTLNFEFNGFFNEQNYGIRCLGESESGQTTELQGAVDGWIFFDIDYAENTYTGNFTAQCVNKENATLLEWEGVEVINGNYTPPEGNEEQYTFQNNAVVLPANSSITWDKVGAGNTEQDMNFADWVAVWKGKVRKAETSSAEVVFSGNTQPVITTEVVSQMGVTRRVAHSTTQRISGVTNSNLKYTITNSVPEEQRIEQIVILTSLPAYGSGDGNFASNAKTTFDNINHTYTVEIEALAPNVDVWIDIGISYTEDIYTVSQTLDYDILNYQVTNVGRIVAKYIITTSGKVVNITLYGKYLASSVSIELLMTLAHSYEAEVSQPFSGTLQGYSEISKSTNVESYTVSFSNNIATMKIVASSVTQVFVTLSLITSQNVAFLNGKIFEIGQPTTSILSLSAENTALTLKLGETGLATIVISNNDIGATIVITPTTVNAYFYDDNDLISQSSTPITYTQQPIASVQIFGGDNGATVESVSVYDNREKEFNVANYENPDFEPSWNDPNYDLYMTANFNGNIQGGTGNAEGSGFQVYRREVGGNVLTPIANVSALTTSLKDYGIRSRKAYEYLLGVYDSNNAFMGLVTAQNTIATCFKNYSLLVCDYDQDKDEYHVRKQYLFALNLGTGSVGNNNSPTLNANFTQYPTRMPSTQNYASGTLQGLIGAIHTVPALIEQIGQYKYTAKPSTLDYFDSVDLEKELYDLSTAPYQLFLRDMKGRLRMIATSGAISMTTNIKQKQQSISISFPWVEIGDASDVTIIQTPDDYGWNNDNQVLDVQLDVDVATGELSATYPYPYNGTKFYLTGVNQETLTAKTPLGITPAQFNLSEVAEEPNDGEVTATVKVNGGGD